MRRQAQLYGVVLVASQRHTVRETETIEIDDATLGSSLETIFSVEVSLRIHGGSISFRLFSSNRKPVTEEYDPVSRCPLERHEQSRLI